MPCVPSIATSKPITLLSQLPSVRQKPTMQHWCLVFTAGHICIQFTVSNSDKMWHPTALDTQPTTVKKRCDAAPLPHHLLLVFTWVFFFFKQGGENRGTVCPYPWPPSSLWLSLSKDNAGIHMQAQRQMPRRRPERCCDLSPVRFLPFGAFKSQNQATTGHSVTFKH